MLPICKEQSPDKGRINSLAHKLSVWDEDCLEIFSVEEKHLPTKDRRPRPLTKIPGRTICDYVSEDLFTHDLPA